MAYLALYRRYRPRDFDSVVGQDYVTRILKNQILSGRVGHAYLFSGIRGTGKTSIAKIFARAINCENNQAGNPCNVCETCINIEKSGIMDIIEIDGASNRGVDEIREIREKVKYPPTLGKYKVYIIDEVHMLTKEAFNALLKTLEEPPAHIVFILATTEPNKLPMTILSRCQQFNIKPIAAELIGSQIEKILLDIGVAMEKEAIDFIAYRGDSSMRDALSLLDQVIDIREGDGPITYDAVLTFMGMVNEDQIAGLVRGILEDNKGEVLGQFKALREAGRDSSLIFGQLIEYLRKVIIVKATGSVSQEILGITESACTTLGLMGKKASDMRFYKMIDFLIEEKNKLRYSGLAAIIVEMALLKLCDPESLMPQQVVQQPAPNNGGQRGVSQPQRLAPLQAPTIQSAQTPPAQPVSEIQMPLEPPKAVEAIAPQSTVSKQEAPSQKPENTAGGKLNTDKLYTGLVQSCQRMKPMLVRSLMGGTLIQKGNKNLSLRFNDDADGKAAIAMLKLPGMHSFIQEALLKIGKEQYNIEFELTEKNYEAMSMVEKTKSIINDENVAIVEME